MIKLIFIPHRPKFCILGGILDILQESLKISRSDVEQNHLIWVEFLSTTLGDDYIGHLPCQILEGIDLYPRPHTIYAYRNYSKTNLKQYCKLPNKTVL